MRARRSVTLRSQLGVFKLTSSQKEVLYLRHKLQRGLLTRDQQPQEAEMQQMAEYITLLENFSDLEVSIIRATKINKVLKAILKLDSIPREEEFKFKPRSESLLSKWNKLLAADAAPVPAPVPGAAPTNGVNGKAESGKKDDEKKEESDKAKSTEPDKTTAEPSPKESSAKPEKPVEEAKADEPTKVG